MATHARGRRGSGRRRLRELTCSVVDTMEILEEVRGKHSGVGGMSKALVQVVRLGLQICLQESDDRGNANANSSNSCNSGGSSANPCLPSAASGGVFKAGSSSAPHVPGGGVGGGAGGQGGGAAGMGTRASNSVFLEGGVAAGGEELLPLGVASVLWELECCAAQARITLMNLNEGRPNHFGVFRAGVYVEEIRMLESKVLDLVQQAANPREEKNASLETTVAAGIRNCVARLWWSRRAGENAELMTWAAFEEAFQSDFGEQLPKTLDVLRKHIAVRGVDARRPPLLLPPPPAESQSGGPPRREKSVPVPLLPGSASAAAASAGAAAETSRGSPPLAASSAADRDPEQPGIWPPGANANATAAATAPPETSGATAGAGASSAPGSWAAAAAAIEATTAASLAHLTAAGAATPASAAGVAAGPGVAEGVGATPQPQPQPHPPQQGAGGTGETQGNSWEELMLDVETAREERHEAGLAARMGAGALGRGISRLLSTVRREWEGAGARGSGCGGGEGGAGDGAHGSEQAEWRVTAGRYEEVTWAHGGLYEAFQAVADPRRVVFSMGVVDDGPHHEGGDGAGGWSDATPVVVQGLLGLSVQQVCCGGQHAAVLTDCGEIFTWGRGGFGRLGHGDTEQCDSPKPIEALRGIPCVQVACGFAYTAAVTASGDLYTWGAGENGRLGLGDVEDRHTPSRVEGLHSKVKEVYAGSVHSCVLTREGTVYAFGKHEYTGHGDKEDVLEPRLIPAFSGGSEALVRQISVGPGGYHTMALTCQGKVYAWGHNRVAQLGIGNSFTVPRNLEGAYFLPSPQLVESLLGMNIVKVVAGWGHSAALTMDGQLYVCGRNYQGQLGLGSPQRFPQNERGHPFQADFCLIDKLQHLKIRQIACGGEHSVAVAENGEVWSFGAGQKGQLGHESTTREDFPRLVQALKRTRREVLHVACGNNCTLVLAGGVAFPSLFERTAAVIRNNPKLWADVESLGLLPPSVVDSLRTVEG